MAVQRSRTGTWTVLVVRVPSEPSRHRVAVWRELRRVGAVQLGHGSWALPDAPPFAGFVDRMVALVERHDGECFALRAGAADEATAQRIRALYDDARRAEWGEFTSECAKCVAEVDKEIRTEKFTLAALDEEEQNVDRLRRWHRELRAPDVFGSLDPSQVHAASRHARRRSNASPPSSTTRSASTDGVTKLRRRSDGPASRAGPDQRDGAAR